MKIKTIFSILLVATLLQACASPHMSQEFQLGKIRFEDGNYKQAFHDLLPLAASGNCEAQYAVGYMYYYGLGVPKDCESGVFWMKKSADQHYEPAQKALQMLK